MLGWVVLLGIDLVSAVLVEVSVVVIGLLLVIV